LHAAAQSGDLAAIEKFCSNKDTNLNEADDDSWSALHYVGDLDHFFFFRKKSLSFVLSFSLS
jgi:hypothetical protein